MHYPYLEPYNDLPQEISHFHHALYHSIEYILILAYLNSCIIHKNPFSPHGDNGFDLLTQKPIYLYI